MNISNRSLKQPDHHTSRAAATISIIQPTTQQHFDDFRDLVREFAAWAIATLSDGTRRAAIDKPGPFAKLDTELADLPGIYGPPGGCIALAYVDQHPAGCAAFFGRDADTMEVKRMYVRPAFRGHRIGQQLLSHLIRTACQMSYCRYVLSSHKALASAHDLYRRAGFRDVPWSREDFPMAIPDVAVCMELYPSST